MSCSRRRFEALVRRYKKCSFRVMIGTWVTSDGQDSLLGYPRSVILMAVWLGLLICELVLGRWILFGYYLGQSTIAHTRYAAIPSFPL